MKNLNKTLKSGFKYSILLSILVILGILIFTIDKRTIDVLLKLNISIIFYAILLNILSWFWAALRYMCLVNSVGKKLNFIEALLIHLSYYFASSVTPTSAGGEPLEIYLLSKRDIKIGQTTAISLLRYVINTLTFVISTPIILYYFSYLFPNKIIGEAVKYGSILFFLIVFLFLISLYKPKPMKRLIAIMLLKLKHFPFLKNIHPYKIIRTVYKTVDDFHTTLWLFLKTKKLFLLQVFLLNILSWLTYFFIAPTILKGFGLKVSWMNLILIQIPTFFLLLYIPTPGGSGAAELLFSITFAPFVPKHMLGIFIIIWRSLTHYFTLFIGGLILIYVIGIKNWGN